MSSVTRPYPLVLAGQSKGQARTCIVLGVSIFGVSLTSNSSGGTPHLALGILSSSSIF